MEEWQDDGASYNVSSDEEEEENYGVKRRRSREDNNERGNATKAAIL